MSAFASATCFYRDGHIATSDVPCPNSNICCPSGDTCMDNGLCRDKNNHPNGSLTTFSPGHTYNYTGLYYTSSCQDRSFQSCFTQCTTSSSSTGDYIWACNSALTSFCCHNSAASLSQFDCCLSGTFSLPSPKVLTKITASSSSASLSTSTTSFSSMTSSSTTQTSAASSPTSTTHHSSTPSGLSSGAKAGIGVGVSIAGIIILVLVALLHRAHRKLQRKADDGAEKSATGWPELEGKQILARQTVAQEAAGQPRSELEGSNKTAESGKQRFELET